MLSFIPQISQNLLYKLTKLVIFYRYDVSYLKQMIIIAICELTITRSIRDKRTYVRHYFYIILVAINTYTCNLIYTHRIAMRHITNISLHQQ